MTAAAAPPLERTIEDRAGFATAVQATLRAAAARSARTLLWVDPDFAGWPLDQPTLIEGLTSWLQRPQRRLVMLAGNYDGFERLHPRFAAWRRDWTHAIDARVPTDIDPQALPTLLLDDGPLVLELRQRDPPHGRAATDAHAAWAARRRIDAAVQRSMPGWPLRPLGL